MLTPFEAGCELMRDETRSNGVSEHAWKCWENGEKPIPERVAPVMHSLMSVREKRIEQIMRAEHAVALWYEQREDVFPILPPYRAPTQVDFRLSQSIAAAVVERGGFVVGFYATAYNAWANETKQQFDGEMVREQWARVVWQHNQLSGSLKEGDK